jgi:hypothetical protein
LIIWKLANDLISIVIDNFLLDDLQRKFITVLLRDKIDYIRRIRPIEMFSAWWLCFHFFWIKEKLSLILLMVKISNQIN